MQLVTTGIMAGPEGLFDRGTIIDVPEITARRLQSLGQAMPVAEYKAKHKKWNQADAQEVHGRNRCLTIKKANEQDEQAWLDEQAIRQSGIDANLQLAAALARFAEALERLETKLK